MNWLEAYVYYEGGDNGIECINLSNVRSFLPCDEDRYEKTEIIFLDGTFILIKGFYRDIRDMVSKLKDGQSACGQLDEELF